MFYSHAKSELLWKSHHFFFDPVFYEQGEIAVCVLKVVADKYLFFGLAG